MRARLTAIGFAAVLLSAPCVLAQWFKKLTSISKFLKK